ncbi:MAG TPA: succinyldiaminopimelate transaminase [Steroidobacteraceae bacterium]|nr:succinyldiaminopimelate transaminase [Steroidobacteraceae bacterium]
MNPSLALLKPYPFERLRALLANSKPPADKKLIGLQIGEPRHPAPAFVAQALMENLQGLGNYPLTIGTPELRQAIAVWLTRRFHLPADAVNMETMVIPVTGTREALFAFVQAVIDRSVHHKPAVLMPNPFYQIYEGATLLADAEPVFLNTTAENDFLPDLESVSVDTWNRCQLLFLCSPGNPTGAVMSMDYLKRALQLAEQYNFIIASDECYSEIYLDESQPPVGLLEAATAMGNTAFKRCVVFHSLSKRSSVPGLRSGFVAGDAQILKSFLLYRTYHGCAMPLPTQAVSKLAWQDETHVIENRWLYQQKFATVLPVLKPVMEVDAPAAGFYLWPRVHDDEVFTRELFEQQHVMVLPGSYLSRATPHGDPGKGRLRISLVATLDECHHAAERIRNYVASL